MESAYDLLVVGSGTAAQVAISNLAAAGWKIAVIDHRPLGGTCALRGCDPKKMLVSGAAAADHARRMQAKGIAGDIRIDWPQLIAFKRGFTDPIPRHQEQHYAKIGVHTYRGRARFTGRTSLAVDAKWLEAKHVLLATGAEPIKLGIAGEEHLITSEQFLALEQLPPRIALVGGGYIAAEFSTIAANAGAQVTVLQRGPRMLKGFDPDLVGWLMQGFAARGIDVRTNTTVQEIERAGDAYRVRGTQNGKAAEIEAELVIHAAGRAPALGELALESAEIATENGRLKLNEYLQSVSNHAVYAAGDTARAGPPLTPVSSHDGRVVAANLLSGNHQKPDYTTVPSVAFTIPPIATVGLSEAQARQQHLNFRTKCQNASDWFTARQAAEQTYGFKVLVEETTDRILGAHLVGPNADEVINLFALAIRNGLTGEQVRRTMFAYPTGASDIGDML
jgi:glutathione reductase (NADPH)